MADGGAGGQVDDLWQLDSEWNHALEVRGRESASPLPSVILTVLDCRTLPVDMA